MYQNKGRGHSADRNRGRGYHAGSRDFYRNEEGNHRNGQELHGNNRGHRGNNGNGEKNRDRRDRSQPNSRYYGNSDRRDGGYNRQERNDNNIRSDSRYRHNSRNNRDRGDRQTHHSSRRAERRDYRSRSGSKERLPDRRRTAGVVDEMRRYSDRPSRRSERSGRSSDMSPLSPRSSDGSRSSERSLPKGHRSSPSYLEVSDSQSSLREKLLQQQTQKQYEPTEPTKESASEKIMRSQSANKSETIAPVSPPVDDLSLDFLRVGATYEGDDMSDCMSQISTVSSIYKPQGTFMVVTISFDGHFFCCGECSFQNKLWVSVKEHVKAVHTTKAQSIRLECTVCKFATAIEESWRHHLGLESHQIHKKRKRKEETSTQVDGAGFTVPRTKATIRSATITSQRDAKENDPQAGETTKCEGSIWDRRKTKRVGAKIPPWELKKYNTEKHMKKHTTSEGCGNLGSLKRPVWSKKPLFDMNSLERSLMRSSKEHINDSTQATTSGLHVTGQSSVNETERDSSSVASSVQNKLTAGQKRSEKSVSNEKISGNKDVKKKSQYSNESASLFPRTCSSPMSASPQNSSGSPVTLSPVAHTQKSSKTQSSHTSVKSGFAHIKPPSVSSEKSFITEVKPADRHKGTHKTQLQTKTTPTDGKGCTTPKVNQEGFKSASSAAMPTSTSPLKPYTKSSKFPTVKSKPPQTYDVLGSILANIDYHPGNHRSRHSSGSTGSASPLDVQRSPSDSEACRGSSAGQTPLSGTKSTNAPHSSIKSSALGSTGRRTDVVKSVRPEVSKKPPKIVKKQPVIEDPRKVTHSSKLLKGAIISKPILGFKIPKAKPSSDSNDSDGEVATSTPKKQKNLKADVKQKVKENNGKEKTKVSKTDTSKTTRISEANAIPVQQYVGQVSKSASKQLELQKQDEHAKKATPPIFKRSSSGVNKHEREKRITKQMENTRIESTSNISKRPVSAGIDWDHDEVVAGSDQSESDSDTSASEMDKSIQEPTKSVNDASPTNNGQIPRDQNSFIEIDASARMLCWKCGGKMFPRCSSALIIGHMQKAHMDMVTSTYHCVPCEFKATTYRNFKQHMISQEHSRCLKVILSNPKPNTGHYDLIEDSVLSIETNLTPNLKIKEEKPDEEEMTNSARTLNTQHEMSDPNVPQLTKKDDSKLPQQEKERSKKHLVENANFSYLCDVEPVSPAEVNVEGANRKNEKPKVLPAKSTATKKSSENWKCPVDDCDDVSSLSPIRFKSHLLRHLKREKNEAARFMLNERLKEFAAVYKARRPRRSLRSRADKKVDRKRIVQILKRFRRKKRKLSKQFGFIGQHQFALKTKRERMLNEYREMRDDGSVFICRLCKEKRQNAHGFLLHLFARHKKEVRLFKRRNAKSGKKPSVTGKTAKKQENRSQIDIAREKFVILEFLEPFKKDGRYQCSKCAYSVKIWKQLDIREHLFAKHDIYHPDMRHFSCDTCKPVFKTIKQNKIEAHLLSAKHTKKIAVPAKDRRKSGDKASLAKDKRKSGDLLSLAKEKDKSGNNTSLAKEKPKSGDETSTNPESSEKDDSLSSESGKRRHKLIAACKKYKDVNGFLCPTCEKSVKSMDHFNNHMFCEHSDKLSPEECIYYECTTCDTHYRTIFKNKFENHQKTLKHLHLTDPTKGTKRRNSQGADEEPARKKSKVDGGTVVKLKNKRTVSLLETGEFLCNICEAKFSAVNDVGNHLEARHKEEVQRFTYKCEICPLTAQTLVDFREHLKSKDHELEIQLAESRAQFEREKEAMDNDDDIDDNLSAVKDISFKAVEQGLVCQKCSFQTTVFDAMIKHLQGDHSSSFCTMFCSVCEFVSSGVKEMMIHVNGVQHEKKMKKAHPEFKKIETRLMYKITKKNQIMCLKCCRQIKRIARLSTHVAEKHQLPTEHLLAHCRPCKGVIPLAIVDQHRQSIQHQKNANENETSAPPAKRRLLDVKIEDNSNAYSERDAAASTSGANPAVLEVVQYEETKQWSIVKVEQIKQEVLEKDTPEHDPRGTFAQVPAAEGNVQQSYQEITLDDYTDEELYAELSRRDGFNGCPCGFIYLNDRVAVHLHKSCHSTSNWRKCRNCDETFSDNYKFTTHFIENHPKK